MFNIYESSEIEFEIKGNEINIAILESVFDDEIEQFQLISSFSKEKNNDNDEGGWNFIPRFDINQNYTFLNDNKSSKDANPIPNSLTKSSDRKENSQAIKRYATNDTSPEASTSIINEINDEDGFTPIKHGFRYNRSPGNSQNGLIKKNFQNTKKDSTESNKKSNSFR